MRFVRGLSFAAGIALCVPAFAAQRVSPSVQDETITIDGAKTPELIPQWDVWGYAFGAIARSASSAEGRGARATQGLPTVIYRAIPEDQHAAFLQRVRAAVAAKDICDSRSLAVRQRLKSDNAKAIGSELDSHVMECRRETLEARDAVLASLPPESAAVVRRFVDARKGSMQVTLKRSQLAAYRLPE